MLYPQILLSWNLSLTSNLFNFWLWSLNSGLRPLTSGLWPLTFGLWSLTNLWPLDSDLWRSKPWLLTNDILPTIFDSNLCPRIFDLQPQPTIPVFPASIFKLKPPCNLQPFCSLSVTIRFPSLPPSCLEQVMIIMMSIYLKNSKTLILINNRPKIWALL